MEQEQKKPVVFAARFTNALTETWTAMTKTKNALSVCVMFHELSPGESIEMPMDWEFWVAVNVTNWVYIPGGKMAIFRGFDEKDTPLCDIQDITFPNGPQLH